MSSRFSYAAVAGLVFASGLLFTMSVSQEACAGAKCLYNPDTGRYQYCLLVKNGYCKRWGLPCYE